MADMIPANAFTNHSYASARRSVRAIMLGAMTLLYFCGTARGEIIELKNGFRLDGTIGSIRTMNEPIAKADHAAIQHVVVVDDGLHRTFFPRIQVAGPPQPNPAVLEKIRIKQIVARGGMQVNKMGAIANVTPFDQWGRRTLLMHGNSGIIPIVQGITEITPVYLRVEGLSTQNPMVIDSRIATSSLSRTTLSRILQTFGEKENLDSRLRAVRILLQSDRMNDALAELEEIKQDFPEEAGLKDQADTLRQMSARRLLAEIEQRRKVGQHEFAARMAKDFPVAGVADATVLKARDIHVEYENSAAKHAKVTAALQANLDRIDDTKIRELMRPFVQEIIEEVNLNTIARLIDFERLADGGDDSTKPDKLVSLAVSGWLMGAGAAIENAATSASLGKVRDLMRKYLRAPKQERGEILTEIMKQEGATPAYVAKIAAHMRPPRDLPALSENDKIPGRYEISIPGAGDAKEFRYVVQLPPEYDSSRYYPCVVSLHSEDQGTPDKQLDWWAGPFHAASGLRLGQATRNGYIVIAPAWAKDLQDEYQYSPLEHAAVLLTLRDAVKRFSIDTDRTFLSGHGMGGDAAWDIALAHPDLWAGVIPISARTGKYIGHYTDNARYVPMYFVVGELDGKRIDEKGNDNNLTQWDRYMSRVGFDVIVSEYLGRGHEHFFEEAQRIFEWMKLHKRKLPLKFEVASMREADSFFWFADNLSYSPKHMLSPLSWPPPKNHSPAFVRGTIISEANNVRLETSAESGTIYLSPEMVDFNSKDDVLVLGPKEKVKAPPPSVEVILEDILLRGDRLHPFWTKVDFPKKK